MFGATVMGLVVFGISYATLSLVEKLIHKLTKNPDKSYKLGVWLFSILIGLYAFLTNFGR